MKSILFKSACVQFLAFMLLANAFSIKAQSRTITLSVDITEYAVNRFIAAQDFPDISGSYNGVSYTLSITAPTVTFSNNQARAMFAIRVAANGFAAFTIPVNVGIDIPVGTLSANQISLFLKNEFPTLIDSYFTANPSVPQWLKPIVKTAYQGLKLTAYPGMLIRAINDSIPQEFSLKINDVHVGSSGANGGKLSVSFSVIATGKEPSLRMFARYYSSLNGQPGDIYLYYFYTTDVKTRVIRYSIYTLDGTYLPDRSWSYNFIPGQNSPLYVPKDTTDNNQIDIRSNGVIDSPMTPGVYLVFVLFESPTGLYHRAYTLYLSGTESEAIINSDSELKL